MESKIIKYKDNTNWSKFPTLVGGVEFYDSKKGEISVIKPGLHSLPFEIWKTVDGIQRYVIEYLTVNVFATGLKMHSRFLLINKDEDEVFECYLNGFCKHISTEDDVIQDDLISAVQYAYKMQGEDQDWMSVRREIVDDDSYYHIAYPTWDKDPSFDKKVKILENTQFESPSLKRLQSLLGNITKHNIPQSNYLYRLLQEVGFEDPEAYKMLMKLFNS